LFPSFNRKAVSRNKYNYPIASCLEIGPSEPNGTVIDLVGGHAIALAVRGHHVRDTVDARNDTEL